MKIVSVLSVVGILMGPGLARAGDYDRGLMTGIFVGVGATILADHMRPRSTTIVSPRGTTTYTDGPNGQMVFQDTRDIARTAEY